ncbi:cytidine deaminase [Aeromicrobium phragmitis]|uniref:Cytidine deaminase n=1 Tax=Aeromicrobium phragmitis TaxID=2478914 RepID=A0A3L8PND6_9ACTN|nr:class I SAM-dependent methyltransferase [Aeromicrobium phragmitis]RLV56905.1 cytidine deaminase [Aeromicrobium phragmitis]
MSAPAEVPDLVARTLDLSRRRGFITSTRNETGRLLAALAASRVGTLAELGTGCGVGSAWLHSGAPKEARIVTAELDPELAQDVQEIFASAENVSVLAGDWSALEQYAPFSLLFVDVRDVMADIDVLADLLAPGGITVLDDFVPSSFWPPIVDGQVDTVREQWLTDERFAAVEMLIDPDASLIIATRR